jgi:hypothetical protein
MPRISIHVKTDLVRQGLESLFAEVPKIGRRRIRTLLNRIQKAMKKPGEKPTYPIKWDSVKQRIAYFASDGFTLKGKRPPGYVNSHIPYVRTGKYNAGWRVEKFGETGYTLRNNSPHGKYIGGGADGSGQSRIHGGRWTLLRDATEEEITKLPSEVVKEILLVARSKGYAER